MDIPRVLGIGKEPQEKLKLQCILGPSMQLENSVVQNKRCMPFITRWSILSLQGSYNFIPYLDAAGKHMIG